MYLTIKILRWPYVAGQLTLILLAPLINFAPNSYWTCGDMRRREC